MQVQLRRLIIFKLKKFKLENVFFKNGSLLCVYFFFSFYLSCFIFSVSVDIMQKFGQKKFRRTFIYHDCEL